MLLLQIVFYLEVEGSNNAGTTEKAESDREIQRMTEDPRQTMDSGGELLQGFLADFPVACHGFSFWLRAQAV